MTGPDARLTGLEVEWALTPAAMWERYATDRSDRADRRVVDWILADDARRLAWLHSIGVTADRELAAFVPPLPPTGLRQIVAATDDAEFLWTGFVDASQILERFERHRSVTAQPPFDVLDFGAGCGRTTRFLAGTSRWSIAASDVNPDHVAWCREALPGVRALDQDAEPPLPVEDDAFDLIFSVSVFTHLRDDRARGWFAELARVLRPGGLLVATTHGPHALHVIENSPPHQEMFGLSASDARVIADRVRADGTAYLPYPDAVVGVAQAGPVYGNCFVSEDHVRQRWAPPHFEVVAVDCAGLRSWQDVVVLRLP